MTTFARLLARFAQGVVVVIVAASIAFLLLKTVKGDQFTHLIMGHDVSAETIEKLRASFGNDKHVLTQYWNWLSQALQGDLQTSSLRRDQPVMQVIVATVPNTLLLMSFAFAGSLLAGIALGAWQGANVGSRAERMVSGVTIGLFSLPDFWVAMILMIVFVLHFGWFPPQGMSSAIPPESFFGVIADRIWHLFLPWLSLTLIGTSVFARYQRAAMRDVVGQHFIRTARAKGVPNSAVARTHALRVAVIPIITIAGMFFPALLVGAILVEKVFGWPGMGWLLTEAISNRDYFLVAGIVVVASAMTALGSFLADVLREFADPRLRT